MARGLHDRVLELGLTELRGTVYEQPIRSIRPLRDDVVGMKLHPASALLGPMRDEVADVRREAGHRPR